MLPALIAAGAQVAGGLIGGKARKKAANKQFNAVVDASDAAIGQAYRDQNLAQQLSAADQARAIQYNDADRAYAAGGLKRLRDEAQAAGFNPLTVLNATGGVGFTSGVQSTPFVSTAFMPVADAFTNKANLIAGAGQARVDAAGYVGDAISAGGSAYFGQNNQDIQAQIQRDQNDIQRAALGRRSGGGGGSRGGVTTVDARHSAVFGAAAASGGLSFPVSQTNSIVGGLGYDGEGVVVTPMDNVPLFHQARFAGYDLWVWNDQATDSELASNATIISLGPQLGAAVANDAAEWLDPYLKKPIAGAGKRFGDAVGGGIGGAWGYLRPNGSSPSSYDYGIPTP